MSKLRSSVVLNNSHRSSFSMPSSIVVNKFTLAKQFLKCVCTIFVKCVLVLTQYSLVGFSFFQILFPYRVYLDSSDKVMKRD